MEQIQRTVADLAIRLLARPAGSLQDDPQALNEIERIATQVLREVESTRKAAQYLPGETRGAWRIPQTH